jgi:hypothetical protein
VLDGVTESAVGAVRVIEQVQQILDWDAEGSAGQQT